MPKLWTATVETHRGEVRDAIIAATAALLGERGLRSVTMSEIAEKAGIGRATLYKYFPDVKAILVAWHERQVSAHLKQLAKLRDQPVGAGEQLKGILAAYAHITYDARDHRDNELAAFLHRNEQVGLAEQQLLDLIKGVLTAAAAEGDIRNDVTPAELAGYCLSALAGARDLSSPAAVDRLVAVTLAGLRA